MKDSEKLQAIMANDNKFDGKFFYGVKSTGIFCRPSCPSKAPKPENVVFFHNADEAMKAGFRPCKRCRPELVNYDPAVEIAEDARDIIDRNFLERSELQEKLSALGITKRHLTGIFEEKYGMSPEEYIGEKRLSLAKELLSKGDRITDVAFSVGMESSSAFNVFFKKKTGMTPSEYVKFHSDEHICRYCETPIGMLYLEEDQSGITSIRFTDASHIPTESRRHATYLDDAGAEIEEYFKGKRKSFDIPLSLRGTEFQMKVWNALRDIPYGETRSYQEIAQAVGNEKAARAVGMANNRNPIVIMIPCHRVIGKDGTPVGYAGGIDRKIYLLDMERRLCLIP